VSRRKKPKPPVIVALDRLDERHTSGLDEDGQRWKVRGAPVGATVQANRGRKQTARRVAMVAPSPDAVVPPCPAFGVCGGCQLQEMPLDHQRSEKHQLVQRLVEIGEVQAAAAVEDDEPTPVTADAATPIEVHPPRGAPAAYGYRNKVELSWGTTRFVPEGQLVAAREGEGLDGSFLGFHPPGWFSRIVPLSQCFLATPAMNTVLALVSGLNLAPAWNTRAHTGTWRHLVIRDGGTLTAPRVLVTLVTSTDAPADEVRRVGAAIAALDGVQGVLWVVTDRLSEVAIGDLREVLHGEAALHVQLGGLELRLPYDAFFQVNSDGAEVLVQTIAEALFPEGPTTPEAAGTLLDLYCGVGAIGLALAHHFARVVGVELHPQAITSATENAERNGITGEWHAGPVEDVLPTLDVPSPRRIVVDPPRVGLHPRAARFLATAEADVLVYVACGPKSLARDRVVLAEGGWKMTDLWTVDLFPQTHHTESVARFVR
jgi:23S rRNA (uracil1939-C5)-methyltransferase